MSPKIAQATARDQVRRGSQVQPKQDDDFFWEGVDQGKLLAQSCLQCGTLRHPPAPMCARCQSVAWEPRELSGRGKVRSWLISKHPSKADAMPRTVVLVDLDEGLRLVSNIVAGESVEIGDPVSLTFGEVHGARFPMFTRKGAAR
jgi:uncharacterized protein